MKHRVPFAYYVIKDPEIAGSQFVIASDIGHARSAISHWGISAVNAVIIPLYADINSEFPPKIGAVTYDHPKDPKYIDIPPRLSKIK